MQSPGPPQSLDGQRRHSSGSYLSGTKQVSDRGLRSSLPDTRMHSVGPAVNRVAVARVVLPELVPIVEGEHISPTSSGDSKTYTQDKRSSMKKDAGRKPKNVLIGEGGRRPSIVMFSPETKGGLEEEEDGYEGIAGVVFMLLFVGEWMSWLSLGGEVVY